MWLKQISLFVLLILSIEGRPISLHNYAPDHEYKSSSSYSFSYGVKDLHTGDVKHQWEKKDGDIVRGHYSVLEPDGTVRTVDYTADAKNGFNAVVKHTGTKHQPKIEKKVLPTYAKYHPITSLETQSVPQISSQYTGLYTINSDKKVLPQDFTTLKESVKTEYQFDDGTNEVKHYYFVPGDEEVKESVQSKIQLPISKNQKYYTKFSDEISSSQLPVDLNLVKQTTEKIIPVDISQLHPVEIDLSQNSNQELSSDELKKFLRDYYQSGLENLNKPHIEGGFTPIVTPGRIPQTYKSNKKPISTPGLRNYSSKTKHRFHGGQVRFHRAAVRVKKL